MAMYREKTGDNPNKIASTYALDVLDRANVYGIGTIMENNPTFRVFLDEDVEEGRLRSAILKAFESIPYMKSKLCYDGIYYLADNSNELPIHHCRFEDRPLKFGRKSGGYLFQVSYDKNELVFDWAHITTDALGFLLFMKAVLAAYFGIEQKVDSDIYAKLPVEEQYDSKAEHGFLKPQAEGFDPDRIPHDSPLGSCRCTILSVSAQQILTYRNRVDATPAAILSALIAETFRQHLKKSSGTPAENNNVKGKIVVSTRKVLDVTTLHNCYMQLFVTYTDAFDKLDFSTVCTVFRAYMDLAVQKESVLNNIKIQKESQLEIEQDPNQELVWETVKKAAIEKRKHYCSFNFSYLGTLPFEDEIMAHIVDFQALCLNENSDFGVTGYSFNDRIYLSIAENYKDDMIAELMATGEKMDITLEKASGLFYQQAYFEM